MRGDPPPDVALYLQPQYWDRRFEAEDHYEWFKDYSHFRHLILENVSPSDRVLEIGCGNSRLSIDMFRDAIHNITCSDLSPIAVQKMRKQLEAAACSGVKAVVADMLNLEFEDNSFDVVIEKGTMDVLFVNSGDPWDPKYETRSMVSSMLDGIHRILSPNGIFISISFSQPHFRRLVFEAEKYSWSMKWKTFGEGFHYFFYTLRKGTREDLSVTKFSSGVKFNLFNEQMDQEDYLLQTLLDE